MNSAEDMNACSEILHLACSECECFENFECCTLKSNNEKLILSRTQRQRLNRQKWKHGFSQCALCQSKLMYELEKGRTLDEVIALMKERHPDIKHIRQYAMNAIRQTTGYGLYDDYIVERRLWKVRSPILAPPPMLTALKKWWKKGAEKGKQMVEHERTIDGLLSEHGDALWYFSERSKVKGVRT